MPCTVRSLAAMGLSLCAVLLAGCPTTVLPPRLNVSRVAFNFNGTAVIDSFTIANHGGGTLRWNIDPADVPTWLDLSARGPEKFSGVISETSQAVTMTLNDSAAELPPNSYQESFTVTSNGGDQLVFVALEVTVGGRLILDPAPPETLDFGATITTLPFTISRGGTESLTWTISPIAAATPWLGFASNTPTTGTITSDPQTITVVVNRSTLPAGDYLGSIVVTSASGSGTIMVEMTVPDSSGLLAVSPATLAFPTDEELFARDISIRNVGAGTITWTAQNDFPSWLSMTRRTGTAISTDSNGDQPSVRADVAGLDPDVYTHTIRISSIDGDGEDSGNDSIDVTLTVPEPIPVLAVSPTVFSFQGVTAQGLFSITNEGSGELNWTLTVNSPFISIAEGEPTSGSVERDADVINFEVDASLLTAGVRTGTITIASDNGGGPITVTITIDVPPPTLEVVPRVLNFSTDLTEKLAAVFNGGTGTVVWNIVTDPLPPLEPFPAWLKDENGVPLISLESGSVTGTQTDGVTIGVNRMNQAPGDYAYASPGIVVNSAVGQRFIEVFMEVAEKPVLEVDTGTNVDGVPNRDLDNTPFVPVGLAETATFTIQNIGTGAINWTIVAARAQNGTEIPFPAWLRVDPLGPRPLSVLEGPFPITVRIDRAGLSFGPQNYTFFISSNDADNPLQPVRVEILVPKQVKISVAPDRLDFGLTGTTTEFFVVNCGDPETVLNFGIESNKPWLFAFPTQGRSIGVNDCGLEGDFQQIGVSVDRSGLDGAGGGTGILKIFAQSLQPDTQDIDDDGDTTEPVLQEDDKIAPPVNVEVSVQASQLFFETPPVRERVPSLVRYIMTMRNLRFETISIADDLLQTFEGKYQIFENDFPVEIVESNQFLTTARNLRTQIVILLDYSASMLESAALAQQYHEFLLETTTENDALLGFSDAEDPLQFMYEACVGSLIKELPDSYEIALMEFHDRNQPSRILTVSPQFGTGFVPNNAAGQLFLLATLDGINVTGHGATEFHDALLEANNRLVAENSPVPSSGPVIPVVQFDDADIRGIISFSDGGNTSSFFTLNETSLLLQAARTRLIALAWGQGFDGGTLGLLSSETGGHLYVTRSLDAGMPAAPIRVPAIGTMFDLCNNENVDVDDLGSDECDLSISQDLRNQVVLSYVTLSVNDAMEGRVAASFDDPNDGGAIACRLPDQGVISGEFVQELRPGSIIGIDAFDLGVRLGQISMRTAGLQNGRAEAYLYVDYMPRDIVELEFTIAAEKDQVDQRIAGTIGQPPLLLGAEGVPFAEDGIFENDWILTPLAAAVAGHDLASDLDTLTFTLRTGAEVAPDDRDPIQYGAFGRLVKFTLDVPGTTPYDFRLLSVKNITRNGEGRFFTHPDGILVGGNAFRAPSFPTPRVTPTILGFGNVSTFETFTVENVGGAYNSGQIRLGFSVEGNDHPSPALTVGPTLGALISTDDLITVGVALDRSLLPPGNSSVLFNLLCGTGIAEVTSTVPILVNAFILDPVLVLTPAASGQTFLPNTTTLDFGSDPQNADPETQSFVVVNGGQSKLTWYLINQPPAWLKVSPPKVVTENFPQPVLVTVDRIDLVPGFSETVTLNLESQATDTGAPAGTADVDVIVMVSP